MGCGRAKARRGHYVLLDGCKFEPTVACSRGPGTSMSHSKKKEGAQMEEIGSERSNGGDHLTVLHIQAEQ